MTPSSVKLFLDVADAGSLSKVAARRQTAQSHISRQVSEFEALCGGRLFHRTGRGVALTELGERAATRLRVWLHDTERLAEELRDHAGQALGQVRLGLIPSAAHPLATTLFTHLRATHPGLRLEIVEAQGAELDVLLDAGAVDLAILFRFARPGGDERLLCDAGTYLVSAPGDPLTARATLPFARLAHLPLVLPRKPSHWRAALDDTARSLGFTLDPQAQADSLIVQKELVAQRTGLYAVLGPFAIAEELRLGRLQASRLVRPDLTRHVTLALPRQGKLTTASRLVAQQIESLVQAWGRRLVPP